MSPILENQEIAKKPRHRLRRFWKQARTPLRFVSAAGGVVLAGCLLWFGLCASSCFDLKKIEIVGDLKQLKAQDVSGMLDLKPGTNIFRISLKDVGKNVAKLAWVHSVSVRRQAPDTLWIHVREQRPGALLLDGKLFFVSEEGVVFKEVGQELCRDLPVLTGFSKTGSMKEAMELIRFLENSADFDLFGLSEIHYDDANGFSIVTLAGPMEIKLGKGSIETKIGRLKKIWPGVQASLGHVKGIDLDYEDRVFVKL